MGCKFTLRELEAKTPSATFGKQDPRENAKFSAMVTDLLEVSEEEVASLPECDSEKALLEAGVPESILAGIKATDWKERQKGIRELQDWVQKNREDASHVCESIIFYLSHKLKKFKESNQVVLKDMFSLLNQLASLQTGGKMHGDASVARNV